MASVGLRGCNARRAQTAHAICFGTVANEPVEARIRLSLDAMSDDWIPFDVWLALVLGWIGG